MYNRRCDLIEDGRVRAHRSLSRRSSSSSLFSASCLHDGPQAATFQHEISCLISKRKPGCLTTPSASLCYHLPQRCTNLKPEHADYPAPTLQHELDHTDHTDHADHTDHTDQEYICPPWWI